jgi:hypothetical protein
VFFLNVYTEKKNKVQKMDMTCLRVELGTLAEAHFALGKFQPVYYQLCQQVVVINAETKEVINDT